MPQLDVSFVVSDPMLADTFSVIRNSEVIDAKGRQSTVPTTFPNLVGVVTQNDPADLLIRDDGIMTPRNISVCSRFAFRGPAPGFQPDVISYQGTHYKVKHVLSFSRFGKGTYEALAESTTAIDPAN